MIAVSRPGAAVLACVLALIGTILTAMGVRAQTSADAAFPAPPARLEPFPSPTTQPPALSTGSAEDPPVPIGLDIPAVGIHTELIRLGLHRDGTVQVPPLVSDAPAGWYENSASPGEAGAAVLLGHVDSARDGPAVFYRLSALRRGDAISVRRADGTVARFTVTTVSLYPKSDFPTRLVYGSTPYPALRLVTCGGSFDRRRGTYRDNVVVYAGPAVGAGSGVDVTP